MAGETLLTIVGNLTADPELRYTQAGLAVANFTVAATPRSFDRQANEWKDGDALFMRCSVWREFAEQVAGSLTKGSRVIVQGRLTQRSYETQQGEKRTSIELQVDAIGPDLRYATATVIRVQRGQGGGQMQGGQQFAQPQQQAQEPWGQQPQGQPQQGGQGAWGAPAQDQWGAATSGPAWNDETPF